MDMVSRLLRWFYGWVRVSAEGGYPERLLNELTAAGIAVWGVRWQREYLRFSCTARDYRRIRFAARRAHLRMRMMHKSGLPFWWHRYRHRKGLLVGLVVYAVILGLLSPRIWVIEVQGNITTPTEEVLQVAAERGVRVGALMSRVDVKDLQLRGNDTLNQVAFVTVNPSHCVARIQVTEREPTPEVIDLSQPSDLVAVCDGEIVKMEIRSGQKLVQTGEAVTAGTRLVTGRVDTELGEKLYRSYGAVWAQTHRRITVSVPLKYHQLVPDGEAVCRPAFTLFCWDFPLYSSTPLQAKTAHRRTQHFLTFDGTRLPLGMTIDYYLPLTERLAVRTAKEAENLAHKQLAQQEAQLFTPNSYERKSLSGRVQGGAYLLTATYLCRENIAVEVPLDGTLPSP